MELVLKHLIFCNTEEVMISKVCNEITQEELESACKQHLTPKKSTLNKYTEYLSLVSLDAQLRFEISQWNIATNIIAVLNQQIFLKDFWYCTFAIYHVCANFMQPDFSNGLKKQSV